MYSECKEYIHKKTVCRYLFAYIAKLNIHTLGLFANTPVSA